MSNKKVFEIGDSAFLRGSKSIVVFNNSGDFLDETKDEKVNVTPKNIRKPIEFVPHGKDNNLPVQIIQKVYKNITTASNVDFNTRISIGDGLLVVKKVKDKGEIKYEEQIESEQPKIFEFIQNNNVNRILQEAAADMVVFYDAFIEVIFNKNSSKPEIVMIRHKEATFSRLSVMNEKTAKIEYHGYSAKWGDGTPDDVIATPFLDRDAPIYDLKSRLGIIPNPNTGKNDTVTKDKRFIMSLALPTPGRFYYNKPYWWAIFESKWYDYACAIPEFKMALIENAMVLHYHVKINTAFWAKLYKDEGITDPEKQKQRKLEFLTQMDDFLAGKENAGKNFVSHFSYDKIKGYEEQDIIIELLESSMKGGEFIEDAEEASNSICYAMGVHPSLQGASPGKGKNINGTEARELFIIKQAIMKPIRDALLSFMYTVKAINGWDPDIHFVIPNIMLTTLDKNTGQVKSIGNQKI